MANTLFTYGGYNCIIFTSSETWTVPVNCRKVDVLVVAGGGNGSGQYQAGGGAGGLLFNTNFNVSGNITVTIGAATQDSVFSTLAALAGGNGGGTNSSGGNGGSGGGGTGTGAGGTATQPGSASGGFGYAGGNGQGPGGGAGGGGGGAGGLGANGDGGLNKAGGIGKDYSAYFGTTYGVSGVFAKGGRGTVESSPQNGAANTGDGGDSFNGVGGTGVVILRYIPDISSGFFHWFFSEAWKRHDKLWTPDKPDKRLILPKDLGFSY